MGIAERKEREKLEMQERIVREATIMFAEMGYEGTSIRGIADRIEYSPATIYLYFKDKDELLLAVQEEAFGKLLAEFRKLLGIPDPYERLMAFGMKYLEFAFENPQLYSLMFSLQSPMRAVEHQDHPKWQTGMNTFYALQHTVEECIRVGRIAPGDPTIISMTMWAHVHGLATLHISCRLMIFERPEEEVRQMMRQSLEYMYHMARKS
jgi:AcrR family transcriptional regulator